MDGRSSRFWLFAGATLLAVATALVPAPALASGAATGVTVFLKAPDLPALQQLSVAHGLTHAQRVAALSKLLPSEAEHAAATRALEAAGMKVTSQTAWSVSATAPSTTVTAAFGTHPAMRAHATPAQRRAASGPYPALPSGLGGVATAAFPTSSGPAMFHPAIAGCTCLDGTDFRNAYTTPAQTALGQPPYSGFDAAATLTIATVQLAGWNSSDLTQWAAQPDIGVAGFNASTALTMVPVDQATVPTPTTDDTGDEEVDLDQEALLSTDPFAHQRPYFAPNTAAGYNDAFAQVLDDVLQDSRAFGGGDPHIAALSVSWGLCEADTNPQDIQTLEPILTSLLAAGVTVFASTGDDGIYDGCSSGSPDVDYPASSPEVVGVGGTALNPVGNSAPNNGTNWAETGWGCSSSDDCATNGGSGGGASPTFDKPTFQSVIADSPFATSTRRLVPDISVNGAPASGFPIFTSDPTDGGGPGLPIFGGTSLATPVSAALFTNVLAAHGATSGIGDIHHALYQAYATHGGSFRDVTSGSNGAAADAPIDPSTIATTGYDTVSGLGAPLWPAISTFLFAPAAPPSAAASFGLIHPHSTSSPRAISATWSGTASSTGLPVQRVAVTITRDGQTTPVFSSTSAPATGSTTFTGAPGATYVLSAMAVDLGGNSSNRVLETVSVPVDDRDFSLSGRWHHVAGATDIAGGSIQTSHRDAAATARATGRSYAVVVHTGPKFGKLLISQGFNNLRTIDLHAAHGHIKTITFFTSSGRPKSHAFRFTCLGKSAGSSRGTKVGIDGMTVVY